MDSLDELKARLIQFRDERDWSKFHTPKDLAVAISVEAGELLEKFQWVPADNQPPLSPRRVEELPDEAADVFIYLIYLCDALGIDLLAAAEKKLTRNAARYPLDKSKGNALKHTELRP